MNEGQRLAAVQLEGHRAIDDLYAPVAAAMGDAVMRAAVPDAAGILRLVPTSKFSILLALGGLLGSLRFPLVSTIMQVAERATIATAIPYPELGVTSADQRIQPALLYQSMVEAEPAVIAQTDALLTRFITAAAPAALAARAVKAYFSPIFSPRRSVQGTLLRAAKEALINHWPGHAGRASQHARMVMLTMSTEVHALTTQEIARKRGGGMRWHVATGHDKPDVCDSYASHDEGYGRGVYPYRDFPHMPTHPNCRCFASAVDLIRQ